MPPRRSSRAPSAQPTAKPPSTAAAEPAASKPQTNGTAKKRTASRERSDSPPPKRTRGDTRKSENVAPAAPASKPPSKVKPPSKAKPPPKAAAAKKAAEPATKKARKLSPVREAEPAPEPKQQKAYFNPLPAPPQKQRPGLLPFAWGAGNFGQFGMGPSLLGEVQKPRKNLWVVEQIESGRFGADGAGMESVASGGLHTVFVDENGTVSNSLFTGLLI